MVVLLPILLFIVLGLGVLYLVVLRRVAPENRAWRALVLTGLGAGVVAAVLTAISALLSFTAILDASPFRDLFGIVAFMGLPVALLGVGCSACGLKAGAWRAARVGLILSVLSILAWLAMFALAG
jgi:hypothetical protein